jgi:YHS domain-containing protein
MSRLILFVFLLLLLYTLLHYLIKDVRRKKLRRESEPEELVQDPYCKTYVPKRTAVRKRVDGRDYYFCNRECLRMFLQERNP